MGRMASICLLGALLSGCQAGGNDTGYVVTPGMVESIPADPYDPSPLTVSGRTLMEMPAGTLQFGEMPYAYGPTKEETARAGVELASPLVADEASLARGKWVYETYCLVCHGTRGEGDGPVIGARRFPNPANLQADHARNLADGALYNILTMGQGLMPTYALQVRPLDRWRVIQYVRELQNPPVAGGEQ